MLINDFYKNSVTRVKVALFIPSLLIGGAERQFIELARGLDKSRWDVLLVTIYQGGAFLDEAGRITGVKIVVLQKQNPFSLLARLFCIVRREKAVVLYTFLDTARFYALLVRVFMPGVKLICRIGDAIAPREYFAHKNAFINFILKLFENKADLYIFNSTQGQRAKLLSVPLGRVKVVHNGIDTDKFRPSDLPKEQWRRTLGVADSTVLVGCLGNFSVYKDHKTFIKAACIVKQVYKDVHFLTIGDHNTFLGKDAIRHVHAEGMGADFTFLGSRKDVEQILPALDIGCSSSMTEGFPNSIGELMACGVPCVVTDVGDSALIVGNTGHVVPRAAPAALAEGIITLLKLTVSQRLALGQSARARILGEYSILRMVTATEEVLESVL